MATDFSGGSGMGNSSNGVAFLVSAGIVYEITAACCSSPQTAELNAKARSGTLMKWVHMGLIQSVVFVGAAAMLDKQHRTGIICGGVAAGVVLYASYVHALQSGLSSSAQPTESY